MSFWISHYKDLSGVSHVSGAFVSHSLNLFGHNSSFRGPFRSLAEGQKSSFHGIQRYIFFIVSFRVLAGLQAYASQLHMRALAQKGVYVQTETAMSNQPSEKRFLPQHLLDASTLMVRRTCCKKNVLLPLSPVNYFQSTCQKPDPHVSGHFTHY